MNGTAATLVLGGQLRMLRAIATKQPLSLKRCDIMSALKLATMSMIAPEVPKYLRVEQEEPGIRIS